MDKEPAPPPTDAQTNIEHRVLGILSVLEKSGNFAEPEVAEELAKLIPVDNDVSYGDCEQVGGYMDGRYTGFHVLRRPDGQLIRQKVQIR